MSLPVPCHPQWLPPPSLTCAASGDTLSSGNGLGMTGEKSVELLWFDWSRIKDGQGPVQKALILPSGETPSVLSAEAPFLSRPHPYRPRSAPSH